MKYILLAILFPLTASADCMQFGQSTYCSDGSSYTQYGNRYGYGLAPPPVYPSPTVTPQYEEQYRREDQNLYGTEGQTCREIGGWVRCW